MAERIGIVHPGEMGISLAAAAQKSGYEVYWASEGRREETRQRAAQFGLHDAETLAALCRQCPVIISVCPPHAAAAVAKDVVAASFKGTYVDANAIAPQRTIRMSEMMSALGIRFVDGGIVGPPAWKSGTTLYLSGTHASDVANFFKAGPLDVRIIGTTAGKASALKMCYAANTKGTVALLAAILATAETLDVREELFERWREEDAAFAEQVERRVQANSPKAWRFVAEMEEISQTFSDAALPGGFHAAAADIYQRLARFKDSKVPPTPDEILIALMEVK